MSKAKGLLTINQNIRLGQTVMFAFATTAVCMKIDKLRGEIHSWRGQLDLGRVVVRTDYARPIETKSIITTLKE